MYNYHLNDYFKRSLIWGWKNSNHDTQKSMISLNIKSTACLKSKHATVVQSVGSQFHSLQSMTMHIYGNKLIAYDLLLNNDSVYFIVFTL